MLVNAYQGTKIIQKNEKKNKLPLPSETLGRYIKKLHPAYGFQENTFHVMKEKAQDFSLAERHGN